MKIKNIENYRTVIERFNGQGPATDDLLLSPQAEKFYVSKETAALQEIIKYIRKKNTAESAAFAVELQKLLDADFAAAAMAMPEPAGVPAAVPLSSPVMADTESQEIRQDGQSAASLRKPGEVYMIELGTEIEIHPLAAAFPIMEEEEEFEKLKSSMEKGQQNPIIMDGNVLLDGRNRLNACRALGKSVKAVQWNRHGTPEELIIALNLFRRHMTAVQRAALAVKLLPALEQQAEERMKAGKPGEKVSQGKAVDLAGKQVSVSGKYVAAAKKVAIANADIYKKLLDGKLSLAQATKAVKVAPVSQPDAEQPATKRYSLYDALREIVKLVHDDFNVNLHEIAEKSPPLVKKAIDSFFPSQNSDTEDIEGTGTDSNANTDIEDADIEDADIEATDEETATEADTEAGTDAKTNVTKDKGYSPEIDF